MVLKSVPFAVAIALVLAWGGIARADDYKPSEYLGLDLSKAVLSPKRLGPETQFAPVALEAKDGNEAQARAEPVDVPKKIAAERVHVSEPKSRARRAQSRVAQHASGSRIATAIRWTRRRWTPASRPGRVVPAASATGSTNSFRLSPRAGRGRSPRERGFRVRGTLRESNSHRPRGDIPLTPTLSRKREREAHLHRGRAKADRARHPRVAKP